LSDHDDCAELCEERGFDRAANLIRATGRGEGRVFVVWPTAFAARLPNGRSRPTFHEDRSAAQAAATRENVAGLRTVRTSGPFFDQSHRGLTDLSIPDFLQQARRVLGPTYWFPRGGNMPLFPTSATDAQLRALLPLLKFRFYEVIEVPLAAGPDEPGPPDP
jgi:hypothetical protein